MTSKTEDHSALWGHLTPVAQDLPQSQLLCQSQSRIISISTPTETHLYVFNVTLLVVVERGSDALVTQHPQASVSAGRSKHLQVT